MRPDVQSASRALLDEMRGAVKIGDLLIDEETGEVLEWPEGVSGDKFEWLTLRAKQAQANIDGWKAVEAHLRRALGHMLGDQRSIKTAYGTPRWASRVDRIAKPERVPKVVQEFELSREGELAIWMTAKELDPKRIDVLPEELVPAEAKRLLVEDVPRGPWVQIDPPRAAPPEIERVSRRREE